MRPDKVYVTVRQSPMYKQFTLDDLLCGTMPDNPLISLNETNTRTYVSDYISPYVWYCSCEKFNSDLEAFNIRWAHLREVEDRHELYHSFKIPKRHGGWRPIDAPLPDLMEALRELKALIEEHGQYVRGKNIGALYHTSAFAYIRGRSCIDAVKRHQSNESKWFAKLDLHNFFGSTTLDFVMRQLSIIEPFASMIVIFGDKELRNAIDLAFLDGVLPQGTPLSPLLTNIMMIPIDHALSNLFREFPVNGKAQHLIYTRYADDFQISSRYTFDVKAVEQQVVQTLGQFEAPFTINAEKTRYGSSAGRNWNLGVMLNANNEITVGHKRKRQFQSALYNFVTDCRAGNPWSYEDLAHMLGLYAYYHMVEPEAIDGIILHFNQKHQVDVLRMMKDAMTT